MLFRSNRVELIPIGYSFKSQVKKKVNKIYKLSNSVTGESLNSKLKKIMYFMNRNKINYLYSSASENVNWLLNIRGKDLPNSPIVNCKLIITDKKQLYFFIDKTKISSSLGKYFKNINICNENFLFKVLNNLKQGSFCIDKNTCSIYEKKIISSRFKITFEEEDRKSVV